MTQFAIHCVVPQSPITKGYALFIRLMRLYRLFLQILNAFPPSPPEKISRWCSKKFYKWDGTVTTRSGSVHSENSTCESPLKNDFSSIPHSTNGKGYEIMVKSQQRILKTASLILLIQCMTAGAWIPLTQAKTIDGVGKLKFGMTPSAVKTLDGCSSEHECLYDILGKNRYFTLSYDESESTTATPDAPSKTLTHIDIDMGNHTKEWFGELYEVLVSQYPLSHMPTEQEDNQFQNGKDQELIIGFAEGSVLLKIVRRQFGNMILRVVYQAEGAAKAQRERWQPSP
jgi:hypothetical protein